MDDLYRGSPILGNSPMEEFTHSMDWLENLHRRPSIFPWNMGNCLKKFGGPRTYSEMRVSNFQQKTLEVVVPNFTRTPTWTSDSLGLCIGWCWISRNKATHNLGTPFCSIDGEFTGENSDAWAQQTTIGMDLLGFQSPINILNLGVVGEVLNVEMRL